MDDTMPITYPRTDFVNPDPPVLTPDTVCTCEHRFAIHVGDTYCTHSDCECMEFEAQQ